MKVFGFLSSLRRSEPRDEAESAPAESAPAETAPDETPEAAEETAPASFDSEFEAAFSGAGSAGNAPSSSAGEQDIASNRELFSEIAAQQARPLKSFAMELRRGTATRDWVEICRPVLANFLEAAGSIGLPETNRMSELDAALTAAINEQRHLLSDETRERLREVFEDLARTLPAAFAPEGEDRRRDSMVLHALLRQIPGVGHVTFERLYGAGLISAETIDGAGPADVEATTGIPEPLCRKICERVREHRKSLEGLTYDQRTEVLLERLNRLRAELAEAAEEYARVDAITGADRNVDEAKRKSRSRLQLCSHRIDVTLAELGELDLIEELRRMAFEARAVRIEEHLAEAVAPVGAAVPGE